MNDQQRAAMQMALGWLDWYFNCYTGENPPCSGEDAITALREALARCVEANDISAKCVDETAKHRHEQPQGEPVVGSDYDTDKAAELGWHLQAQINAAIEATKEKAAQVVDHILKEGGGTYGDAIRGIK